EEIGQVDDLIISKKDNVLYAVLSVGGFLGLGDHLVAVPYDSIEIAEDLKLSIPGATEEQLKNQPEFHYTKSESGEDADANAHGTAAQ
ncbi:MAG: PRC-barrel domain-containing protein, partial [Thiohalocapsa sp.]